MAHQTKNIKNGGGSPQQNGSVIEEHPTSASSACSNNAPKYGTVVPNRIFVGGISPSTTEVDLNHLFSQAYGRVVATKIILDRAGVSKGYGFVTFETEEEAKRVLSDAENIILKERKLNIAPAVKKQGFSRGVENGTVLMGQAGQLYQPNGVSFSYHNGMAFFNGITSSPLPGPQPAPAPIDPNVYQGYVAGTPQIAPVLYSTQMYYQAAPPLPMTQGYSAGYSSYQDVAYDGGEVYAAPGNTGYQGDTTCYQTATSYPVHQEYRRVLALPPPPPTHYYEPPHYIEVAQLPYYGSAGGRFLPVVVQQTPVPQPQPAATTRRSGSRRPQPTPGRRGGRGGSSRSGSSVGGGEPLTPPNTPPRHDNITTTPVAQIQASVQALAIQ